MQKIKSHNYWLLINLPIEVHFKMAGLSFSSVGWTYYICVIGLSVRAPSYSPTFWPVGSTVQPTSNLFTYRTVVQWVQQIRTIWTTNLVTFAYVKVQTWMLICVNREHPISWWILSPEVDRSEFPVIESSACDIFVATSQKIGCCSWRTRKNYLSIANPG
mgnify:CR=1 FL=1